MTTLRPIRPEPGEQALMDILAAIARRLATHRLFRGSPPGEAPLAVKGGTGLVMGLGLTRPSTDLDIDVSKRSLTSAALADAVREIAGGLPGIVVERCDVKQHGRGFMRLWLRREGLDGRLETKIDMQVCDGGRAHSHWEARPNGIDPDSVAWVDGAPIYRRDVLIAKKLNTLVGERVRQQARDLYDAAWILCRHPQCVARESLRRLDAYANSLSPIAESQWERLFSRDAIMSRADFTETWLVLTERLDALLRPRGKVAEPMPAPDGDVGDGSVGGGP